MKMAEGYDDECRYIEQVESALEEPQVLQSEAAQERKVLSASESEDSAD